MYHVRFSFFPRSPRAVLGLVPVVFLVTWATFARFETVMHADKSDVQSFFGTDKAKVVYTNKSKEPKAGTDPVEYVEVNSIEYIDFSEQSPTVRRLENVPAGYLPVISPDGRWVVYTDSHNGEAGGAVDAASSIFICELSPAAQPVKLVDGIGHEPRFVYNTDALGAEYDKTRLMVVFPTKSPDEGWEGHGETKIIEVDTAGGTPVPGAVRTIYSGGSLTGGLSYDANYLCGGGGQGAITSLEDGVTNVVAPIGYGTDTAYTGQACNASISSDPEHTDRMMFLDFGRGTTYEPSINGGNAWVQWQVIFITDYAGNLINHFSVPKANSEHPFEIPDADPDATKYLKTSWTRWHHPEWSNHPAFAVATVNMNRLWGFNCGGMVCSSEKQERIYFINVNTGGYLDVMGPGPSELVWDKSKAFDGLHWPYLWVDKESAPVKQGLREIAGNRGFAQIRNGVLISRSEVVSVEIFGPRGRLIRSRQLDSPSLKVAVGNLRAGAYTVRVRTAEGLSQSLRHFVVK